MADIVPTSNKSGKKNRKRRGKKEGNAASVKVSSGSFAEPVQRIDPVEDLRQRLSEAKLSKNNELANRLRQQLWIAQDLSAGIEPNVSSEDADTLALVQEVKNYGVAKPDNGQTELLAKEEKKVPSLLVGGGDPDSKKLKSLRKKLTQIEKLKERQKSGEKLESNQLEKIKSESELLEEIRHVEQLLSIPIKL